MTQLSTLIQGSGKNAIDKRSYIATAAQTTFTVTYSPPYVDVYQNGVRLNVVDYTATSGTSITLGVGAAVNDEIEVLGFISDASIIAATNLASQVTGVLPAANGGTSLSSPGTSGNILTSNGTTWTSATLTVPQGIPNLVIVSATTQTAVAGNHYVLTNAAASTLTLPASPVAGNLIYVTSGNALATNVIAYNGNKIMGLLENLTINTTAYTTLQLRYLNATIGWALI
jgi:hypothetical protein